MSDPKQIFCWASKASRETNVFSGEIRTADWHASICYAGAGPGFLERGLRCIKEGVGVSFADTSQNF